VAKCEYAINKSIYRAYAQLGTGVLLQHYSLLYKPQFE